MKTAILATGAALLLAVLLSSPTFAQTSAQPAKAAPAPAPIAEASADTPLDGLLEEAMTLEDRAMLVRRCAGPPPQPLPLETAPTLPAIIAAN
ncbi:MAG TPA: hypothetical protein PK080_14455 [Hyphomonadaceae bacterium]|nr:hypothetical protein [Hyphomonadaceae bacterium]